LEFLQALNIEKIEIFFIIKIGGEVDENEN